MFAIEAFVFKLKREGISLWLDEGNIRYRAPAGKLTAELKAELRSLKAPIVAWLRESDEGAARIPALSRQARPQAIPLSFAQERLWVLDRLMGPSTAYNVLLITRLHGSLDISILQQSLSEIVRRHEALRTRIVYLDGQPGQVVDPSRPIDIRFKDFSALPTETHALRVAEESETELSELFDLERGPLLRAVLIRLRREEHVLLIPHHHIISDAWSIGVVLSEMSVLYSSYVESKPSPLQDLSVQYADFTLWQRSWLKGELLAKQVEYWRKLLDGASGVLELPTDRSRAMESVRKASIFRFSIPDATVDGLRELAKSEQASLFMVLLAAFQVVLARWTGQDDIVVGSPISGRRDHQLAGLVGFFVNTLVFRGSFSADQSIRELVRRTKTNAVGNYANQDVPFEKLVETLHVNRDLTRTPIFQVMFSMLNLSAEPISMHDIVMEPVASDVVPDSKFDLSLTVSELGPALHGTFEYPHDLFLASTIERVSEYFVRVLSAMTVDAEQSVLEIDLLPPAERELLLETCNRTDASYPSDMCIHQLFEQQVRHRPDAIALVHEGQSLTYAQLNVQANRLAHYLIGQGVKPDDRVAICVERSLGMAVGLLAILKAAGAYVPLDPSYPAERLTQLLNDCGPHLLLTDAAGRLALGDDATQAVSRHVDLDRIGEDCAAYPTDDPDPQVRGLTPQHLAYIIYTSGSTGTPKGVMVEHAQVVRLFEATRAWYDFDETDTWCLFHSFAFDFSVWEMWGAWSHGGRLIMVPRDVARSADDFHRLVCTTGVTVLNQTPSAFRGFIDASSRTDLNSALRYVIFGGEALEPAMLAAWYARHADSSPRLVNMYGITETTVHVTFYALQEADCARPGSPIGRPIPDLRIYLLDALGQPVPLGATGEIHVGGAGVARGYLNRPELTAERFKNDPFNPDAGARMYRSGDLARYLPDGRLEFFGRNDQQVKVRGFRIELGEIEARLAEHVWVNGAVVRAVEDEAGDKRLTAYLVLKEGADTGEAANALRAYLARRLPDYMVPVAYVPIAEIPLTAHGKLDTKVLPRPDGVARVRRQYEAPRTVREEILCEGWSDVLQVERVGVNDNFFEIGGDSILSLKIVRRARADGLEISVNDVFTYQTVAGLAQAARQPSCDKSIGLDALHLDEDIRSALPPTIEDAYPLTAMQALMVAEYTSNRQHGLGIYHVQQCFEFKDVRPSALAMHQSLKLLIAAHPIFRTRLIRMGASTVQGITAEDAFTFEFVDEDLRACCDAEREMRLREYIMHDRNHAFADAALLRFAWFRTADDMFVLVHSIHHAIDDGWGNQQFLSQLFQAYVSLRNGDTPSIVRAGNVFREYVALQSELARSAEAREFWTSLRFCPCGVDTLQRHYGRPQNPHGSIMTIDPMTTRKLRATAKHVGVSLKAVLLGAYLETIKSGACIGSPTVGVIVNGRSDRLSDPLGSLGLFWNMLPLGHDEWIDDRKERVRAIQRELSDMERYAAFPHSDIERHHGSSGLFFATFNYVDFHNAGSPPANEGIELTRVYGHDKFHYPLNYAFSVNRSNDSISVHVQHDNEYFDARDVHALNVTLLDLLEDIGALST